MVQPAVTCGVILQSLMKLKKNISYDLPVSSLVIHPSRNFYTEPWARYRYEHISAAFFVTLKNQNNLEVYHSGNR